MCITGFHINFEKYFLEKMNCIKIFNLFWFVHWRKKAKYKLEFTEHSFNKISERCSSFINKNDLASSAVRLVF